MHHLKSYLWWILIALLGQYLVYFGLLDGLRQRNTGEYGKVNALANPDSIYQLVILGSSWAETGVIPSLLVDRSSVAFNFAFMGASVMFEETVLETLLTKNAPPKVVILCLDVHSLEEQAPAEFSNKFLVACANPTFRRRLFNLNPEMKLRYYFAPYGLMRLHDRDVYGGLLGYLERETQFDHAHHRGYVPVPTQRNTKWMNTFPDSIQVKADPAILQSLDRIANRCKEREVQLMVVFAPMPIDYKVRLHGFTKIQEQITKWSTTYDLPYLDLTSDTAFDDPERYMDNGHMDSIGAKLVTERISSFLSIYSLATSVNH